MLTLVLLQALPLFAQGPGWFDPTRVDNAPLAEPVRTQHSGTFNGVDISYEAIAGELLLAGKDGAPAATMFSTGYVRSDAGAAPNRPVMFLFNGGPGASSSPLHLGVGPMRRPADDPEGALVPNPSSPLDEVDLVFVDPVGTGYTRLLTEGAGEQFWGIAADADSVLFLIRDWLEREGRQDSPVYLMGESYGGMRAAVVAARAEQVRFRGVLLLSPALDFSAGAQVVGNNLPFIALVPSMAATAAYHQVTDRAGRSFLDIFDEAAAFAVSDYAAALYQGNTIDPADKARVANRLSQLIGLPADYVLQSNLRVDRDEFSDRLLGDAQMRVGRLDARAKGPIAEFKDKRPPGNDPGMSSNQGGGRSTGELLDEYFAGQLGVRIERPYRTLNLDLNQKWDYGQKGQLKTYYSVAPRLQEAMQDNPELRVFIGGGVFDLVTPIMAARYTASQIDVDPGRFVFAGFEGGHTVFEHEASRKALSEDIRSFVAADEAGMKPAGLPDLSITLEPGGVDDSGNPSWVDVTTRISGADWKAGEPFLRIPVKFAGVPAAVYRAEDIEARDADGELALQETVDDPDAGGFLYFRRWSPGRDTAGEVQLKYRAPIGHYVPTLGAGPPFDLRAQDGGLSGALNTFLIMPDSQRPFMIAIDWRLQQLAEGSIAVSSFGEGNTRSPGPSDRLIATYVMAGPLGRYRSTGDGPDFTGYWIGQPRFDADALLAWSARAYGEIADFFQADEPPPYRVLMRGNPYPGGGGAALMGSYLLSFPDTLEDGKSLRETIAHETVHNWIGSIGGPPGSSSWFSEGATVAYTRRLLLRSGLFTPAEFLDSVNDTALGYYTNAQNTLPNDEIAAGFWRDTRIRSLPYQRGSLYFAAVDAAVREKSAGARSLDDLVKAFVARQAAGEAVTGETWREIVTAELGAAGGEGLDEMLAGKLVVPPPQAFGPCFTRKATHLRRFELGFDRAALVAEPRIVSGLIAGSAAALAGLRNGDEILHPVVLEKAQNDPEHRLQLEVKRGDDTLQIEYLPRGETVDGWLWERVDGVPDTACAL